MTGKVRTKSFSLPLNTDRFLQLDAVCQSYQQLLHHIQLCKMFSSMLNTLKATYNEIDYTSIAEIVTIQKDSERDKLEILIHAYEGFKKVPFRFIFEKKDRDSDNKYGISQRQLAAAFSHIFHINQ